MKALGLIGSTASAACEIEPFRALTEQSRWASAHGVLYGRSLLEALTVIRRSCWAPVYQLQSTTPAVLKRHSIFGMSSFLGDLPSKTLLVSRKGSHTVKPRPMRSIAALRNGMWAGIRGEGGASNKCDRAIAVKRAKLLLPEPTKQISRSFFATKLQAFYKTLHVSCIWWANEKWALFKNTLWSGPVCLRPIILVVFDTRGKRIFAPVSNTIFFRINDNTKNNSHHNILNNKHSTKKCLAWKLDYCHYSSTPHCGWKKQ